jgi:hypothetical protein
VRPDSPTDSGVRHSSASLNHVSARCSHRLYQQSIHPVFLVLLPLNPPFPSFRLDFFSLQTFRRSIAFLIVCLQPPAMPLEARVKSVLSGDTVVLSHVTNPGQERVLSLAYVSAPRLRREGDEVSFPLPAGCESCSMDLDSWPF